MNHSNRVILDDAFGWITPVVFFGGIIVACLVGLTLTAVIPFQLGYSLIVGLAVLWVAVYASLGFKIVPYRDYIVIERFGEVNKVVHAGPRILCIPGLIDKIAFEGTLKYQEMPLFADEPNYKVDFTGGVSARVAMKASWRVGPWEDGDSYNKIDKAIIRFHYTMNDKERKERIEDLLEATVIPQLQSFTLAEALIKKHEVTRGVPDEDTTEALADIGVQLNPQEGLIISDIEVPDDVIKQREKELEGEMDAKKQTAQGLGYARSIKAIMDELGISFEQALNIYQTQRGLETLGSVKANVSFVAPDINGIQKTMGIGNADPRHERKEQT